MNVFPNQFSEIADLLQKLFDKYPSYVHFDFTVGTNWNGNVRVPYVKFNIYTPEIMHNEYAKFDDFAAFINRLLADGVKSVATRQAESQLESFRKQLEFYKKQVETAEGRLAELKKLDDFK